MIKYLIEQIVASREIVVFYKIPTGFISYNIFHLFCWPLIGLHIVTFQIVYLITIISNVTTSVLIQYMQCCRTKFTREGALLTSVEPWNRKKIRDVIVRRHRCSQLMTEVTHSHKSWLIISLVRHNHLLNRTFMPGIDL